MLKQGWCKRMREKRRGRSVEESSGGGGGGTQRQRENIKRQGDIKEREQRLLRQVQTKNGGTERLFNDRNRPSRRKRGKRGRDARTEKQGGKTTDWVRSKKSEGVPETDVALAGPSRLIASGPLPCQALTPPSSAVIYRLRLARFKHYSVAIMAREGEWPSWEIGAELNPCSSEPSLGVNKQVPSALATSLTTCK